MKHLKMRKHSGLLEINLLEHSEKIPIQDICCLKQKQPQGHTIFRPVVPAKELWEQVLRIGATQHYAIVDGDWRKELEDFAEIMNFEFYSIK